MISNLINKKCDKKVLLLFIVLILFYVLNTSYLLYKAKNTIVDRDSALHYTSTVAFYNIIRNFDLSNFLYQVSNSFYAPLHSISAAVLSYFLNHNYMAMILILNSFYFLILLIFTYLIGKETGDRLGFFSVIILALYPAVYMSFKEYYLDFPIMAIMSMSVYFLFKSEYFKNRKWSILLGVSCGWGMMLRMAFGAFITAPLLIGVFEVTRSLFKKDRKPVINFFLFIVIFISILSPRYFNVNMYIEFLNTTSMLNNANFIWYSARNLMTIQLLWAALLSPPFFMLLIAGTITFITNRKINYLNKLVILLWFFVPFLILFFMPKPAKYERYFLSMLPAIAIISASAITAIPKKGIKISIMLILIVVGTWQYFSFNYCNASKINKPLFRIKNFPIYYYHSDMNHTLDEITSFAARATAIVKNTREAIRILKINGINKPVFTVFMPWTDCCIGPDDGTIDDDLLQCIFVTHNMPVRVLQVDIQDTIEFYRNLEYDFDLIYYTSEGTFYPYDILGDNYFSALRKEFNVKCTDTTDNHSWETTEDNMNKFFREYNNRKLVCEYGIRTIFLSRDTTEEKMKKFFRQYNRKIVYEDGIRKIYLYSKYRLTDYEQ